MDRNKEKEVKKKVISAPRPEANEALKAQVKEAIDESVFENADYVTGDIQPSETTRTTSLDNIVSKERIARSTRNSTKLLKTAGGLDLTDVERYYPALEQGLSDEQVTKRFSEGLFNYTSQKGGKSYLSIFLSNIFTFFNMLMISVAIALIVFGASITKFAFMVIVTINITIGIVQEIRSKRTVEKMKLMTAPTAVVIRGGERRTIPVNEVVLDDIIYVELGKQICSDCVVVKGEAELNESLLTGESVPVKKKQGDMLYSGSFVSGGSCYARVEKVGAANYVEKLTSYAKRYKKPKSELRNSITTIIKAVSCIIVPVATLMLLLAARAGTNTWEEWSQTVQKVGGAVNGMIPAGLFLLTSIALATSVIRLAKNNTLVQDLYCIEMLARVNVLCLDKTGTITDGTMSVHDVVSVRDNPSGHEIGEILGSMLTATGDNNQTALAIADKFGYSNALTAKAIVPFSSQRKLSAVTFEGEGTFVLGAPEFVVKELGAKVNEIVTENAKNGYRVVMLAHSPLEIAGDKIPVCRPVSLLVIQDHIRPEALDVIRWFKENNVDVRIISGDNPITVAEVARRVGVAGTDKYVSLEGMSTRDVIEAATKYTVFGRVTPEQKCTLIKALKTAGKTVAMTGDGVNDILAMREADCSVAMASGSEAARNVSHLVLLDSNFASMPKVVMEGRRVVNNIQKTSTLFLMKTLMSVFLSVISVIMRFSGLSDQVYFFDTSNLTGLEMFVIGLPSFALALQPNRNIIKGSFLSNVLKQCIPGGITLTIAAMSVYAFGHGAFFAGTEAEYTTIMVTVVMLTGVVALVQVCSPFNAYRAVLTLVTILLCLFSLTYMVDMFHAFGFKDTLFGDIVNLTQIGFLNFSVIVNVVLANYFVLKFLTFLSGKIHIGEIVNGTERS